MIYLIHGVNQVESRRFLIRFKSSYQDIQPISGKNLKSNLLQEKLKQASHHLFGGKSAFLIDNFNGDWGILPKKLPKELDIILWSDQKIELKDSRVKSFLFDQQRRATAFKLADAILFKNEKEAQILSWRLNAAKEPPEKIIGAILRSFFVTFCAKEGSDIGKLPSFARQKVAEQAKIWSKIALKKAVLSLLRTDLSIKEGKDFSLALNQFISQAINF